MKIKCINKPDKFKNLTLNSEYEATENGEFYDVQNDNGSNVKYSKRYFQVIPDSINLSTSLEITIDEDIIIFEIAGIFFDVMVNISIDESHISCGIQEIYVIAHIKSTIDNLFLTLDNRHLNYIGNKLEVFTRVMDALDEYMSTTHPNMCYLISDAIRDGEEEYNEHLSQRSTYHLQGYNPNSGNEIILWIFS